MQQTAISRRTPAARPEPTRPAALEAEILTYLRTHGVGRLETSEGGDWTFARLEVPGWRSSFAAALEAYAEADRAREDAARRGPGDLSLAWLADARRLEAEGDAHLRLAAARLEVSR